MQLFTTYLSKTFRETALELDTKIEFLSCASKYYKGRLESNAEKTAWIDLMSEVIDAKSDPLIFGFMQRRKQRLIYGSDFTDAIEDCAAILNKRNEIIKEENYISHHTYWCRDCSRYAELLYRDGQTENADKYFKMAYDNAEKLIALMSEWERTGKITVSAGSQYEKFYRIFYDVLRNYTNHLLISDKASEDLQEIYLIRQEMLTLYEEKLAGSGVRDKCAAALDYCEYGQFCEYYAAQMVKGPSSLSARSEDRKTVPLSENDCETIDMQGISSTLLHEALSCYEKALSMLPADCVASNDINYTDLQLARSQILSFAADMLRRLGGAENLKAAFSLNTMADSIVEALYRRYRTPELLCTYCSAETGYLSSMFEMFLCTHDDKGTGDWQA